MRDGALYRTGDEVLTVAGASARTCRDVERGAKLWGRTREGELRCGATLTGSCDGAGGGESERTGGEVLTRGGASDGTARGVALGRGASRLVRTRSVEPVRVRGTKRSRLAPTCGVSEPPEGTRIRPVDALGAVLRGAPLADLRLSRGSTRMALSCRPGGPTRRTGATLTG